MPPVQWHRSHTKGKIKALASYRQKMESKCLGELADVVASGSGLAPAASAELARRAAEAQERAAVAQECAADAAKETARYTRASARYMRWSVIVLAASSATTAFFLAWDHFLHRP